MSTFSMPSGFPKIGDFEGSDISEKPGSWRFHRDGGSGGKNYGEDHLAPNDTVVVAVTYNVTAEHHTKGSPAFELVMKAVGPVNVPVGFHIGHRLTPEGLFGAGATFQGDFTLKCVSLQKWMNVFIANLPH
jgi:hypothetical protein